MPPQRSRAGANGYQPGLPNPHAPRATRSRARRRQRRLDASRWHWLLFIPIVLPLMTPLYNRMEPALFGLPFYYWSQLSFALLSTVVIAIVHVATKGR